MFPNPEKLREIMEKLEKEYPPRKRRRRKKAKPKKKVEQKQQATVKTPQKTTAEQKQPQEQIPVENLEPQFKGVKGVCVECGTPLGLVKDYFTCSICGANVCTDCEKAHVAKCMYKTYGAEGIGEPVKKQP